jgi:hypothetical protein
VGKGSITSSPAEPSRSIDAEVADPSGYLLTVFSEASA